MKQNTNHSLAHRLTSVILAVVMLMSMVTTNVQALTAANITTDLGEKEFKYNTVEEFSVTTQANDDAGKSVSLYLWFDNPEAIKKIEYQKDGIWNELQDTYIFGIQYKATEKFNLDDSSIKFRVLFCGVGEFNCEIILRKADTRTKLCETTASVKVGKKDQSIKWKNEISDGIIEIKWKQFYFNSVVVEEGYADAQVKYSSSDNNIARVYSSGKIEAKKPGQVIITARKAGSSYYNDAEIWYTLIISKIDQKELVFSESGKKSVVCGTVFTNTAKGGSLDNKICYASSDENIATVDEFGKVSAIKPGTVKITATKSGDDYYNEVSSSYELNVLPETKFEIEQETIRIRLSYLDFINKAICSYSENIIYSSSNEDIAVVDENGAVTPKMEGEVDITATIPATGEYEEKSVSYKLVIWSGEQEVVFENTVKNEMTFGEEYKKSASANTDIKYSSSNEDIATVDEDGNVTTYKAGQVIITATAVATEEYEETSNSYELTINLADPQIIFAKGTEVSVTYNDNENSFLNEVKTNDANGKGKYIIVEGADHVKDFDELTGAFTIIKAGFIKVKFVFEENEQYFASEDTYELTVNKAQQTISFYQGDMALEFGKEIELLNGDVTFIMPVAKEIGNKYGSGDIIYTLAENNDNVIEKIDTDGKLVFTNEVGTVKICATKLSDDNYYETSTYYVLKVGYAENSSGSLYEIKGEQKREDSDWYTGDVSIMAKDGYEISLNKKADWNSEVVAFTDDGIAEKVFYIRNKENGVIYEPIEVCIQKDSKAPDAIISDNKDNKWSIFDALEKVFTILSFGLWEPSEKNYEFKIEYSDKKTIEGYSNILKAEYFIHENVVSVVNNIEELETIIVNTNQQWKPYKNGDTIAVKKDSQFVLYAKVTDNAGNVTYINTNGIMFDMSKPEISVTLDETKIKHDEIPVYNHDVNVAISIKDGNNNSGSGIKLVKYWVTCNGKKTQGDVLFENKDGAAIIHGFDKNIVIFANQNNSCDVVLNVEATDNACNIATISVKLDIDITLPKINVTYDSKLPQNTIEQRGYYSDTRIAEIEIIERAGHFIEKEATNGIKIKAEDFERNPIVINGKMLETDDKGYIKNIADLFDEVKWSHPSCDLPDESKHILILEYKYDANYTFDINYTDLAQNRSDKFDSGESLTPCQFTVDMTKPSGTVSVGTLGTWDRLIEILTFGLWSNDKVNITGTKKDDTSPIMAVYYYKTDNTVELGEEELNSLSLTSWEKFDMEKGFPVSVNEKFVVYVKIVDYANNIEYISTDGIVIDDKAPSFEKVKPEITIIPEPANGIYNSDVSIGVSVIEPKSDNAESYAGLKKIRYEVYNLGVKTQEGILYSFEFVEENNEKVLRIYNKGELVSERKNYTPTYEDLLSTWEDKAAIVVDKDLNNSNDVKIVVYAVDNANNKNEAMFKFKIDTTPSEIDISFDNNNGESSFVDSTYFKNSRIAKITVKERNFSPEYFKYKITNTEGFVPVISDWATKKGTEPNGDDTTHTATIIFDKDGDYTFKIESCEDLALNDNKTPNAGDSLAPWGFTIDKTSPIVSVTYDNNEVLNGNYYKTQRVATITVKEHNFEALSERFNVKIVATNNGKIIQSPTIDGWISEGDVHKTTITYAADAYYTFDIEYTDKAGNKAADIDEQRFYVDKTNPILKIEKIADKSANNDMGNIGFVITAMDVNFDVFKPRLIAVAKYDDFEPKIVDIGEFKDIENGKIFTVTNIEEDGIYQIYCTVMDKAGNAYSEVLLEQKDGSEYIEKRSGDDILLTFSINRNGSTFDIDENTKQVIKQYYIKKLNNDILVTETNVDALVENTVTLNGKPLVKDKDYTVTSEGGNNKWMKYVYNIKKDLFANEGEYIIVVSSKDQAENNAYSDIKGAAIAFVVDRTPPVVSVSGLSTDGRYQTESHVVTLIPTDDGGALNNLVVNMIDKNGKIIKEIINLSGDKLVEELNKKEGKITFEISEGLYQNVQILCSDCATGDLDETNSCDIVIENISVSSNSLMILWANKPLRWGIIGGVSAAAIALAVFIILKKKKRKIA